MPQGWMSFLTIRGCILGIKKETPRKTWRFLNSAGVGAGFRLSRTAVFFTAEDSSIYPTPFQIRATPPPRNITTRNKASSKNLPGCDSNVMPPHDDCQYFSIPSLGYLLSVYRGRGAEKFGGGKTRMVKKLIQPCGIKKKFKYFNADEFIRGTILKWPGLRRRTSALT